jgi:hypothetical protein
MVMLGRRVDSCEPKGLLESDFEIRVEPRQDLELGRDGAGKLAMPRWKKVLQSGRGQRAA